ncbi:response regulator [Neptunicella sp. SCSIO 80796]|uniref:response regulator n=1 Tax=Neptunicella plasticusilytica TaxID=3117012 RepID=UPI003A4E11FC
MSFPILICDDSNLARRMVLRSLPQNWDTEIHLAENGFQAMDILRTRHIALLFLDLTMPEMDGVAVLEAIREEKIETYVLVVSGDIQPQMQEQVMKFGALDFITKPVDQTRVETILQKFGFYSRTELISA